MVICGFLYMGICIARIMKYRVYELYELNRVIGYIEGELRYNHSLLYEAVMKVSQRADKCFKGWLVWLSNRLSPECADGISVNDIWMEGLLLLEEETHLKKSDIELLHGFGQAFGYLDISAQQNAIFLERNRLNDTVKGLDKSLASHMKLAVMTSFLCGLFLVIILL